MAEEVGHARCINQVDEVVFVLEEEHGGSKGVLVAFFLVGKVAHGRSVLDRAHALNLSGCEKEAFCECGLATACVSNEREVSDVGGVAYSHAGVSRFRKVRA